MCQILCQSALKMPILCKIAFEIPRGVKMINFRAFMCAKAHNVGQQV